VAMAHFHVGYTLVCMRIDSLRPVLSIADDLPGFLLTIPNGVLCIAFRLQNLLYGLFSLWR